MTIAPMRRFHPAQPAMPEIHGTINNRALATIIIHCTGLDDGFARAITAQTVTAIATITLKEAPPE